MPFRLLENIDDSAPGTATFELERGQASEVYVSDGQVNAEDIKEKVNEVLGTVSVGNGRLDRRLPRAHPAYPALFATGVQVQGVGHRDAFDVTSGAEQANPFLEGEPIADEYFVYARCKLRVTFQTRPYALLNDSSVTPVSFSWTDFDGNPVVSTDSQEYLRYIDVDWDPQPTVASVQLGQLWFATGSGAEPGGAPPNGFPGHPWVVMNEGQLVVTWYHVPYSVFASEAHAMHRYVGHINQTTFLGHSPGTLLYMGAKAVRYTPPFPEFGDGGAGGTVVFSNRKNCNVRFAFQKTGRQITDAPATGNANWVAAGHNTQIFMKTRKAYYVRATETTMRPQFPSFPAQLLFGVS